MKPPFFDRSQLEERAELLRRSAVASGVDNTPAIELQDVVDFALGGYQLCLDQPLEAPVEGYTCFFRRKIFVSARAERQPARKRFTIAHEFGHVVLHTEYMLTLFPPGQDLLFEVPTSAVLQDWRLEWQANYFAAAFLLPRSSLLAGYERYGEAFIDAGAIAGHFGVSQESARRRLHELSLLSSQAPQRRLL